MKVDYRQHLGTAMFAVTLVSVAVAAPQSETDARPGVTDAVVVRNYASVVLANYEAAHLDALKLEQAVNMLLADPSESTLAAARALWIEARRTYLQTEAYRFYEGPIDAAGTGPEGRLNAWPINEGFIDYVQGNLQSGIINEPAIPLTIDTISGKDQVTDEADVTTGWHAIEFLLWGQDLSTDGPGNRPSTDYLPGPKPNERRRAYLKLVTQKLVDDLAYLVNAWKPDSDNYRTAFEKTPRESLQKVMTALATLSGFELASERIAVGLESRSQEDEQSCFSDTTQQDFAFDQKGIENVFFGRFGEYSGAGVYDLLEQKDATLAEELASQIHETNRLIAAIHAPYDQVLASPEGSPWREATERAMHALEKQADLFVKAGEALGLDVEIMAE